LIVKILNKFYKKEILYKKIHKLMKLIKSEYLKDETSIENLINNIIECVDTDYNIEKEFRENNKDI